MLSARLGERRKSGAKVLAWKRNGHNYFARVTRLRRLEPEASSAECRGEEEIAWRKKNRLHSKAR